MPAEENDYKPLENEEIFHELPRSDPLMVN